MTHLVTQQCCNDAACVPVCPVNCIHPSPDEPDYGTAEMLYIDPDVCIDCGVCVEVCPVGAIVPDHQLNTQTVRFAELNQLYYEDPAHQGYEEMQQESPVGSFVGGHGTAPLRVAIVGSGPAAFYAAEDLLSRHGLDVEVEMFERLPTPYGLVRYGVAPDHGPTKEAAASFATTMRRPNFEIHLNVEIGRDITHAQLLEHHHAVLYAVGAASDHALGIPGEKLAGSHAATEFVAWYNGNPEYADRTFDLNAERAVIVGNGNVALDVARILTRNLDELAKTDISSPALEQLAESKVREVVVVGRRGPGEAAFTTPELMGLTHLEGVDVMVDELDLARAEGAAHPGYSLMAYKMRMLEELSSRERSGDRLIVLKFLASPVELLGCDRVTGVRLVRNRLATSDGRTIAVPTDEGEELECGLVLRSVGYRGVPIPDLPFDDRRGVVPHDRGRVLESSLGVPAPGTYVAGWIKRGPTGVIGSNKHCARETVDSLLADYSAGTLATPTRTIEELRLRLSSADALDGDAWRRIDAHEKALGRKVNRPRVKITSVAEMLQVAKMDLPS